MLVKYLTPMTLFLTLGCATVAVDDEAADGEEMTTVLPGDGDGDSGGDGDALGDGDTGTGGVVIISGSGGTTGDGDGDLVGDGDGDLVGDGDGDVGSGGTSSGGTSSGGTSSGGTSSGGTSSGGTPAMVGSPAECLAGWETSASASACLEAGQDDRVQGCTGALDCWQMNDCTPTECSGGPDADCGQNNVNNLGAGRSFADTVFAALCN